MDPVTIAVLAVLGLAGSGGIVAAVRAHRAGVRREKMRRAVRMAIPIGADPPVSLFDVLWDLGASDFALEIMASQGLLLEEPEDLRAVAQTLGDAVASSGRYATFIDEGLEAIQEYYREHRGAGNRRAIPALSAPVVKALPSAGGSDGGALRVPVDVERSMTPGDRSAWRRGDAVGPLHGSQPAVDVDRVLDLDLGRLLGSIFDGSIGREAKRWFAMRSARTLRGELDRALAELYRTYAESLRPYPAQLAHLYDAARRWDADAHRIDLLLTPTPPFADRPWASCGEILLEEARSMARALALAAAANVDEILAHIDELAAKGNVAMAGYFVYVNRHPLFLGRMELAMPHVGAIETALARLQHELGELQRKGVL